MDEMRATERGEQRHDEVAMAARVSRGTWIGLVLGGVVLGAVGAWVGWVAFDSARAVIASALGGAIAGSGLGAFVGGLSRLESPDPGREPSETDHPLLRGAGGFTTEEHPGPEAPAERHLRR